LIKSSESAQPMTSTIVRHDLGRVDHGNKLENDDPNLDWRKK